MKPLNKLNNVEKARLLFQLFPDEISDSLDCINAIAKVICNDPSEFKAQWEEQTISADSWIRLAQDVKYRIEKYGDQLFDGYDALFTIDCLRQYTVTKKCSRPFSTAIEMLFG